MSETGYDEISKSWQAETENSELQNLEDLRLGRMAAYLSKTRLSLSEVPAGEILQTDLLTQEVLNMEFMLNDLLRLRRKKILNAALSQRRPLGTMTLAEEEYYNRVFRAVEGHLESVKSALAGAPLLEAKAHDKGSPHASGGKADMVSSPEEVEYVSVVFLRPVETAFVGLDEETYGPFKAGDNAMIPVENARTWLRDGTVARMAIDKRKVHD